MPCCWESISWHFNGSQCLYLQDQEVFFLECFTPKMKALQFPKMSVTTHPMTVFHIPEDFKYSPTLLWKPQISCGTYLCTYSVHSMVLWLEHKHDNILQSHRNNTANHECTVHQDIIQRTLFEGTLTLRRLMSYIYGAPILDVSRSHTTTQHSQ